MRDEAAIPPVAVAAFVAFLLLASAAAYVWSAQASSEAERPPHSVVLAGVTGVQAAPQGEWKEYAVSFASPAATYGDLSLRLNGVHVNCAPERGNEDSWRLLAAGGPLPCDEAHARAVRAGDVVELWAAQAGQDAQPLRLRELTLVDEARGAIVFTIPVT